MGYVEAIDRWRALSDATRRRLRWQAIPQQVAESMAFEGEPVDLAWLTKLHPPTPPPAGSKPPKVKPLISADNSCAGK